MHMARFIHQHKMPKISDVRKVQDCMRVDSEFKCIAAIAECSTVTVNNTFSGGSGGGFQLMSIPIQRIIVIWLLAIVALLLTGAAALVHVISQSCRNMTSRRMRGLSVSG
jgi:hypothetical protein